MVGRLSRLRGAQKGPTPRGSCRPANGCAAPDRACCCATTGPADSANAKATPVMMLRVVHTAAEPQPPGSKRPACLRRRRFRERSGQSPASACKARSRSTSRRPSARCVAGALGGINCNQSVGAHSVGLGNQCGFRCCFGAPSRPHTGEKLIPPHILVRQAAAACRNPTTTIRLAANWCQPLMLRRVAASPVPNFGTENRSNKLVPWRAAPAIGFALVQSLLPSDDPIAIRRR
jgi:hypothetical protein